MKTETSSGHMKDKRGNIVFESIVNRWTKFMEELFEGKRHADLKTSVFILLPTKPEAMDCSDLRPIRLCVIV